MCFINFFISLGAIMFTLHHISFKNNTIFLYTIWRLTLIAVLFFGKSPFGKSDFLKLNSNDNSLFVFYAELLCFNILLKISLLVAFTTRHMRCIKVIKTFYIIFFIMLGNSKLHEFLLRYIDAIFSQPIRNSVSYQGADPYVMTSSSVTWLNEMEKYKQVKSLL